MNKTARFLTGILWISLMCTSPAFAQRYDNYIHHPKDKRMFQKAIEQATFPLWGSLKLTLQGRYGDVQKEWKNSQQARVEEQRLAIGQQTLALCRQEAGQRQQLSTQELLSKEVERQSACHELQMRWLLRYDNLQKSISDNDRIFPGYVLQANTALLHLTPQHIDTLEQIFKGTGAQNTPSFPFGTEGRVVHILTDSGLRILADGWHRTLTIQLPQN